MVYGGGSKRPRGVTQFVALRQAFQHLSLCFCSPVVFGILAQFSRTLPVYWIFDSCLLPAGLVFSHGSGFHFRCSKILDVHIYYVGFIHTCHVTTLSYFLPFLVCTSFGLVFLFSFSGFAPDRFCQFCCLPLIF